MKKIKKTIGLDEQSYELIKAQVKKELENFKGNDKRLISSVFEKAIRKFSEKTKMLSEPINGKIVKRQTIYLSEEMNSKFNKLVFKHGYTIKRFSNFIIKTVYA